jgi:hypothetical protein
MSVRSIGDEATLQP